MRSKLVSVDGHKIRIPDPSNLDELRQLVESEEDLFYLAQRKWVLANVLIPSAQAWRELEEPSGSG